MENIEMEIRILIDKKYFDYPSLTIEEIDYLHEEEIIKTQDVQQEKIDYDAFLSESVNRLYA